MARSEFSAQETRMIGSFPGNTILAESGGRGWRNLHASLATVNTWSGNHEARANPCIAYCVNQPAYLCRRTEGGREEELTLRPRQFFVIPSHQNSEWHRRGRTDMLMIYLRQQMLDGLADELSSLGAGARTSDVDMPLGTTDAFMEQFALAVLNMLRSDEDGSGALFSDALSHSAALHLLRRTCSTERLTLRSQTIGITPGLRRVADFIEAELGGDITLAGLAKEAGLSMTAFGRAFRTAYHTSPHKYVTARRIERAKTLLISTALPIAEIALDTGFSSQSHLTTAFGHAVGIPPAEYRREAFDGKARQRRLRVAGVE